MDCRVVVEAAIPVYDVATPDEAIRIAISKTGEMLNPDLSYVEISMSSRTTPGGEELPPAFVAADEALVALELEMTVFNVEQEEHATRVARKEIGQRLENVPLKVLSVERIPDSDDESDEGDDSKESETDDSKESETDDSKESEADDSGKSQDGSESGSDSDNANDEDTENDGDTDSDDLIPEFDDLLEDG